jgi:hypothetical protein
VETVGHHSGDVRVLYAARFRPLLKLKTAYETASFCGGTMGAETRAEAAAFDPLFKNAELETFTNAIAPPSCVITGLTVRFDSLFSAL